MFRNRAVGLLPSTLLPFVVGAACQSFRGTADDSGHADADAPTQETGSDARVDVAADAADAASLGFCASRPALTLCDDFEVSDGGVSLGNWTLFGNASVDPVRFRSPSTSMRSSTSPVDGGNPNGEVFRENIPVSGQSTIVDFGFDIRPDSPPDTVSGLGYVQLHGQTGFSSVSLIYSPGSLTVQVVPDPAITTQRANYLSQAPLPVGAWSRVDLTVKLSTTSGQVTLAIEGRPTVSEGVTLPTAPDGVNRLRLGVGLTPSAGVGSANYDNITLDLH